MSAVNLYAAVQVSRDDSGSEYTFIDVDRPVLTYKYASVAVPSSLAGNKSAVARSGYIHPVYGPTGEMLTSDYPVDHTHHRGIYWAWPEVSYNGVTHDQHALLGVFSRPVKVLRAEDGEDSALLEVENVWMWEDSKPIVREVVAIRVHSMRDGLQAIDLELSFLAIEDGVQIARREKVAYGGLNVRMSAFSQQTINKEFSANDKDSVAVGEIRGIPPDGSEMVGILMLQSPTNPDYPCEWIDYPEINWLQPTFPAKGSAYTLDTEEPLVLKYRFVIRSGQGLALSREALFSQYAGYLMHELTEPLRQAMAWEMGDDSSTMSALELRFKNLPRILYPYLERSLLDLLSDGGTSAGFRIWICDQLALIGGEASIPSLLDLLQDDDVWMDALDALMAIPCSEARRALMDGFLNMKVDRQVSILALMAGAGPEFLETILQAVKSGQEELARVGLEALGASKSEAAATALLGMQVPIHNRESLFDAKLRVAHSLLKTKSALELPRKLYLSVWEDPAAGDLERAAALKGLVASGHAGAMPLLSKALSSQDRLLFAAGVAALYDISMTDLGNLRTEFSSLDPRAKQAVVTAWGARGVQAAVAEIVEALQNDNIALKSAAVVALIGVEAPQAIGRLVDIALSGGGLERQAHRTLRLMRGDGVDEALKAIVHRENEAKAVLAVEILGARLGGEGMSTMLALIDHKDAEVVSQALTVIRNEGRVSNLPALRQRLILSGEDDKSGIARAIVGICLREEDASSALMNFIGDGLELDAESRRALIQYVHAVGGEAVANYTACNLDEDAISALGRWPDETASEALLGIVESSKVEESLRRKAAEVYRQYAQRVLDEDARVAGLRRVEAALEHISIVESRGE